MALTQKCREVSETTSFVSDHTVPSMEPGARAAAKEGAVALATEDVVQALIDHFVGPCLPNKASVREKPQPVPKQEAVGKQLHGVVLLYNYFLRKRFPHLEPLDFTSFCKLATVAKPSLLPYLQYMHDPSRMNGEKEGELSIAEKKVVDACLICAGLDASLDAPNMAGWPVSKVAVLVADHTKEKCFLRFGSATQGVWSLVEKDVPAAQMTNKAILADDSSLRKLALSAVKEQIGINEADLVIAESSLSYSLSRVKTATQFYVMQCIGTRGVISEFRQTPIKFVVSSLQCPVVTGPPPVVTPAAEHFHLLPYFDTFVSWFSRPFSDMVPRMMETKTNADNVDQEFEILPCKNDSENLALVLIPEPMGNVNDGNESSNKEDAMNKNSSEVFPTTIENKSIEQEEQSIKYLHSSFQNISIKPEAAQQEITHKTESYSCTIEIPKVAKTPKKSNDSKVSAKMPKSSLSNQSENNVTTEVFCKRKKILEVAPHFNDIISNKAGAGKTTEGKGLNQRIGEKSRIEKHSSENNIIKDVIHNSTKDSSLLMNNGTYSQDDLLVSHFPVLALPSSVTRCEKIGRKTKSRESSRTQIDLISQHKETQIDLISQPNQTQIDLISQCNQTPIDLISQMRRRDELHHRYSQLEEELMQCEMDIQTVLAGEQNLTCNGNSLMEARSALTLNATVPSTSMVITYPPLTMKRRRLSEAVLFCNPCQELDDICRRNNWILPQYVVLPLPEKGGFESIIVTRGLDFELTERGEVKQSLHESKESAASCMLKKLFSTSC